MTDLINYAQQALSASLINLAIDKNITIRKDQLIHNQKKEKRSPLEEENQFLKNLFPNQSNHPKNSVYKRIKLDQYEKSIHQAIHQHRSFLASIRANYFHSNHQFIKIALTIQAIILLITPNACFKNPITISDPTYILYIVMGIALLLINYCFIFIIQRPKQSALNTLRELKGFKMFLKTTDEEHFKIMTPDLFEQYLSLCNRFWN